MMKDNNRNVQEILAATAPQHESKLHGVFHKLSDIWQPQQQKMSATEVLDPSIGEQRFNFPEDMSWTQEASLKLIELYRSYSCLWDPTDPSYKKIDAKADAWFEISEAMQADGQIVQTKMNSLLASFRRERQRIMGATKSGSAMTGKGESKWFAFKSMAFLLDKFKGRESEDTNIFQTDNPTEQAEDEAQKGEKKRKKEDPRVQVAFDLMTSVAASRSIKDVSQKYGDFIAEKHRSYTPYVRTVLEYKINKSVLEADLLMLQNADPQDIEHIELLSSPSPPPPPSPSPSQPSASTSTTVVNYLSNFGS